MVGFLENAPLRIRVYYTVTFILTCAAALGLRELFRYLTPHVHAWYQFEACGNDAICIGNSAVERVTLGLFLFFIMHSIGMVCASPSPSHPLQIGLRDNSPTNLRRQWLAGFWGIKILLLLVTIAGFFFIPHPFFEGWAWVCRFGAGLFILLQILILIDFAYSWNSSWAQKDERKWDVILLVVSLFLFLFGLVTCILLFVFYCPEGCDLNIFFVVITLVFGVIYTALSIWSHRGALLPSAVVFSYCAYVCWSALQAEPGSCHLLGQSLASSIVIQVLGAGLAVLSIGYATHVASSDASLLDLRRPLREENDDDDVDVDEEGRPLENPKFSHAWFHLVFAMGAFYACMLLTSWASTQDPGRWGTDRGWIATWVKMGASWATAVLYTWSLVAPYVLPDREWDD